MVRGHSLLSEKKVANGHSTEKRLRLDTTLFALARAAGCGAVHSPENAVQMFCHLASSFPCAGGLSGGAKNTEPDAVVLISDAIESVLEGYGELVVSPAANGMELPDLNLTSASLANLCSIATCFSHRPALSSPLLAAFFQLTILVVKYAPLQALDAEGCGVLVSLLELLRCLPRGPEADGGPGIQQVARITGRNIMRRICPRIFVQDVLDYPHSLHQDRTAAVCSAAVSEQVDRNLLPWLERQLLPLHVVSGEGAQADLKEDRRLALSLLNYLCLDDNADKFLSSSRRLAIFYIADAVASLLEEENGSMGINGNERQLAFSFLERAKRVLSSGSVSAVPRMGACNIYGEPDLQQVTISTQDAQEFLLFKDAAYVKEFNMLRQRIVEERRNQDILQRKLEELARDREEVLQELRNGLFDLRVPCEEENAAGSALAKGDLPPGTDEGVTSSFSADCAWDVESFLEPLERLTVELHDKHQKEHFSD